MGNSTRISEYSNCCICISLPLYLCTGLFALKDCVQDERAGEVMSPYLASVAPLRSQQLGCYQQPVVRRGIVTTCISQTFQLVYSCIVAPIDNPWSGDELSCHSSRLLANDHTRQPMNWAENFGISEGDGDTFY